jgi:hypothetical protein
MYNAREVLIDKITIEDFRGMLKQCFCRATNGYDEYNKMIDDMEDVEIEIMSKMITFNHDFLVKGKNEILGETVH